MATAKHFKFNPNTNMYGVLLGFLSCFAYAFMDMMAKYSLSVLHTPYNIYYFYTNLISLILILIYIGYVYVKHNKNLFKFGTKLVFIPTILSACSFAAAFLSLSLIPLDIFYSVVFASPIFTTFLGIFVLKEEFNKDKLIALALGFSGIMIITSPYNVINNNISLLGIMLVIVVVIGDVALGIFSRRYLQKENAITIRFYLFLLASSAGLGFLVANYLNSNIVTLVPNAKEFVFIVASSVSMLIAALSVLKAYQKSPASMVATTYYSFILWAIIFGYFIFGDLPTEATIVGALLIIIANIYLYFKTHVFYMYKKLFSYVMKKLNKISKA